MPRRSASTRTSSERHSRARVAETPVTQAHVRGRIPEAGVRAVARLLVGVALTRQQEARR